MNIDRVVRIEFDNGVQVAERDDLDGWSISTNRETVWEWWDGEKWREASFYPKTWPFEEARVIALALPRQEAADAYEAE